MIIVVYILGVISGVCYTLNVDELFDGRFFSWVLSPVTVPIRIAKFFLHPPVA